MNVLDPFEVAEICVWPLDLKHLNKKEQKDHLDRAEFTVFEKVIAESKLGAVLNEKPPLPDAIGSTSQGIPQAHHTQRYFSTPQTSGYPHCQACEHHRKPCPRHQ